MIDELFQGFGGQFEYFGLWIDSEYGMGHSKAEPTCSTYVSPQLSAHPNFTFDYLEVWGVGAVPEEDTEVSDRSSFSDSLMEENISKRLELMSILWIYPKFKKVYSNNFEN